MHLGPHRPEHLHVGAHMTSNDLLCVRLGEGAVLRPLRGSQVSAWE